MFVSDGKPPAPRISVAMSVYNNRRFVKDAVDSILAQTFGDFEFLIVDDGSTDGSGDILRALAARDRRIRLIQRENRGLVPSLNQIIDLARAPLLARMDGDDLALPERFERQIAFLDAHRDHIAIGTSTYDMDEGGQVARHHDHYPTDHAGIVRALEHWSPLCHSSVMMRTAVVRAHGGYREAYRHCEDYDLWLRLSQHGRLGNLPEQLLYYRRSRDQVSRRHSLQQQTGAVIAWLAHLERIEGRPDPTDGLPRLPSVDRIDTVFRRPGVARTLRARLAPRLVYAPESLRGEGFALLVDHLRDGGDATGQWRTVARLLKFRCPARAARLALLLLAGPAPRNG